MAPRSRQSVIHYLHPDGWRAEDAGAALRIRARVSRAQQVVGEWVLEEPDGRGGWRTCDAPADRARLAEGWQWFAWRAMRRGEPVVRLEGVRPLDAEMARALCEGIVMRDPGGRQLESAAEAGLGFSLTPEDAALFRERVLAAGGAIIATPPDPGQAATAGGVITRAAAAAQAAAQAAMAAIDGGGAAGRISPAQLDALVGDAWSARRDAHRAREEMERAAGGLAAGRSTDEAAAIVALEVAARSDLQRIDDAIASLAGAQREAALQFLADQGPGAPPLVAPFDQWHAHIAARLRAQGQDATVVDGELVVRTPAGVVHLGKTLRITPP